MHRRLGAFVLLCGAPLLACSSADLDTGDGSGGQAGSTLTAGSTSSGGTSASGGSSADGGAGGGSTTGGTSAQGGASADPCQGVPSNGVCVDAHTVKACRLPPPGSTDPPVIQTVACDTNYACSADPHGGASCKLTTVCDPGSTQCSDDNGAVETCKADGSGYDSSACASGTRCGANPGEAVSCIGIPGAAGTGQETLSGCITFESHGISVDGVADQVSPQPGVLQFVAVYNGDNYIGAAVTGAADGCFQAPLTEPATADTTVYVYALDFDPDTGNPLVGVVHNDDPEIKTFTSTNGYWHWSNQDAAQGSCAGIQEPVQLNTLGAGQHSIGTTDHDGDGSADMLIPECEGSGALRIFQWVRFGMVRLGPDHHGLDQIGPGEVVHSTEGVHQPSLAAFWEPGVDAACGACFIPGSLGGATVDLGGGQSDHYDTLMQISGSNDSPTQWSYSVLSHEFGHYVMATYSKSPGEGGPHYVAEASIPGLAYSEGWATAFGAYNVSTPVDVTAVDPAHGVKVAGWDPIYIDVQEGTTFYVNIDAGDWSGNPSALEKPDPNGGLDQNVNENILAGMIFKLMGHPQQVTDDVKGPGTPGAASSEEYAALGAEAIFKGFQSQQLVSGVGRGYPKIDMIDFLDAQKCAGVATGDQIQTVSTPAGYPWDGGECE